VQPDHYDLFSTVFLANSLHLLASSAVVMGLIAGDELRTDELDTLRGCWI